MERAIVGVTGLKVICIIGILPDERVHPQEIIVDIKVECDFTKCAKTDGIDDAIDYVAMAERATTIAVEGRFHLLECYATHVINSFFEELPISWASIKVEKPAAIKNARCSMVELERRR